MNIMFIMRSREEVKMGETKGYYCWKCRDFTKQKPQYNKDWQGNEYVSSYRCMACGDTNSASGYNCPECGAESNEDTFIESFNSRPVLHPDYWNCHEWEERHKCWNCGTVYEFINSNY